MGGCDEVAAGAAGGFIEELVTGDPAGLFEAHFQFFGDSGDIGVAADERNAELIAEGLAEFELLVGLFPLAVVEVGGNQVEPAFVEEMKEAGGIGPAAIT